MTSPRRTARALIAPVTRPDQASLLDLLRDPDAPLWADQEAYREFMAERGWSLTASERMGRPTHPHNRRNRASSEWAQENGLTTSGGADWHALRSLGLVG